MQGRPLGTNPVVEHPSRPVGLALQPFQQSLRTLAAQLDPLARTAQPVERRRRVLASACSVGELLFRARAIREQCLEALVDAPSSELCGHSRLLVAGQPLVEDCELELRDSRAERRDLPAELLGAFGSGRLESKRTETLAHLFLDVTRARDLKPDPGELQLRSMLAALEPT